MVTIVPSCGHQGQNWVTTHHLLSTLGAELHAKYFPCVTSWDSHVSPWNVGIITVDILYTRKQVPGAWVACWGSRSCNWPSTENPIWNLDLTARALRPQANGQKTWRKLRGPILLSGLDSLEEKEEEGMLFFPCPRNSLCWLLLSAPGMKSQTGPIASSVHLKLFKVLRSVAGIKELCPTLWSKLQPLLQFKLAPPSPSWGPCWLGNLWRRGQEI